MTLTIEIPDDLAARMESIPADQRNNYAVAALVYGVDNMPPQEENDTPATGADLVTYWEEIGVVGMRSDIQDAPAEARRRRGQAEAERKQ